MYYCNLTTTHFLPIITNLHGQTFYHFIWWYYDDAWCYTTTDLCTCPTDLCTCWAATHVCSAQYLRLLSWCKIYLCASVYLKLWWVGVSNMHGCVGSTYYYPVILCVCHCPSNCVRQVTVCWCACTWHYCSTALCSREAQSLCAGPGIHLQGDKRDRWHHHAWYRQRAQGARKSAR